MNYNEMSDFEINKAVAEALNIYHSDSEDSVWVYVASVMEMGEHALELRGYCNNPSDAWPIIVENGIIIFPKKDRFIGASYATDFSSLHKVFVESSDQLLRAAMIVFLKIKESK